MEMLFKLLLKTVYQAVPQFQMQVLQISGSSGSCHYSCVRNVSGMSDPKHTLKHLGVFKLVGMCL